MTDRLPAAPASPAASPAAPEGPASRSTASPDAARRRDEDPLRHSAAYRVRFDEAGPDGLLRTSGLLRYAQDVGWQHSEALGLDRAWYDRLGLAWVVRAAEIRLSAPIPIGATLDVTTQVLGYQRSWARRRAEARTADGAAVARIQTDWVLIDGRGRLARVPAVIPERFPAPLLTASLLRVRLGEPPPGAAVRSFRVRPHELDPMDHANNAAYVDWLEESVLEESVLAATGGDRAIRALPRRLRLEYAASAGPGAEVVSTTWPTPDGWAVRLTGDDGRDLLRATIDGGGPDDDPDAENEDGRGSMLRTGDAPRD